MIRGAAGRLPARGAAALIGMLAVAAPTEAQHAPILDGCSFLGNTPAPLHLDRLRISQLRGDHGVAPLPARSGARRAACDTAVTQGFHATLLPLHLLSQYNSRYPRESLNGLRWGGVGLSAAVTGGVTGSWGPLSAALAPVVAYHGNEDFPFLAVPGDTISPFANYWMRANIDLPQRFGSGPVTWAHLGDTYIRFSVLGTRVGWSTETVRWGPARRYPILLSGAAPGFPHVFVGTARPIDIWIGHASGELLWGHLAESDYFDDTSENDRRLVAGLVAEVRPRGLDGLSLAFRWIFQQTIPPEGLSFDEYLARPFDGIFRNVSNLEPEGDNELFSFSARWVLPESELEVYGEFARDDHWDGPDDFFQEPEHSAGFLLGLQKLLPVRVLDPDGRLRLAAEVMTLNASETHRVGGRRPSVIFYAHAAATQGHTHRGQLLGSPTGPASDAQVVEVDWLSDAWMAGAYLERVRYAADIYWARHARRYGTEGHDVELTGGLRGSVAVPGAGLELLADVAWSGRHNRDFIALVENPAVPRAESFEHNLSLQIGASWRPGPVRSGSGDQPSSGGRER